LTVAPPAQEGAFAAALAQLGQPDENAARWAREHHERLTKPPGSLGVLEALGAQLAAIAGTSPPPLPAPGAIAVFAGDHGVAAGGVTAWPQEVTAQMLANIAGGGAAINVLARAASASVTVIDVGVATGPAAIPGVVGRRVRAGTANLADGPAMTTSDARRALDVGAEVAADLVAQGAGALVTGDMGIANTTPAAALVAAFTGRPCATVTGRGTGVDDAMLATKVALVERAVARLPRDADPLAVLATVGGLEHAAIAGFIVGGAAAGVPVVVDGVIALSGLLAAAALAPSIVGFCIAGHRSPEPGASAALDHLGLRPVLDLGMRLGEGTGACLALPVIEAAARLLREMATFDAAGVAQLPR
jgi:nicotinate-nucleotide--dimethylbenzimidazole phosphoribosyltransferase